jgi:hypothetical protein
MEMTSNKGKCRLYRIEKDESGDDLSNSKVCARNETITNEGTGCAGNDKGEKVRQRERERETTVERTRRNYNS